VKAAGIAAGVGAGLGLFTWVAFQLGAWLFDPVMSVVCRYRDVGWERREAQERTP
jgi:hypothetical protein